MMKNKNKTLPPRPQTRSLRRSRSRRRGLCKNTTKRRTKYLLFRTADGRRARAFPLDSFCLGKMFLIFSHLNESRLVYTILLSVSRGKIRVRCFCFCFFVFSLQCRANSFSNRSRNYSYIRIIYTRSKRKLLVKGPRDDGATTTKGRNATFFGKYFSRSSLCVRVC